MTKSMFSLAIDAFSDGQIQSKTWLCRELEAVIPHSKPLTIWVFAGWHGLLPFLMFTRERLNIGEIILFDVDPEAVKSAEAVNSTWARMGRFRAVWADVTLPFREQPPTPDVVVNTSCEHFHEQSWWRQIPDGAMVVLQSTDMDHEEHFACTKTPEELRGAYPDLQDIRFSGQKEFVYDSWRFARNMMIGTKLSSSGTKRL